MKSVTLPVNHQKRCRNSAVQRSNDRFLQVPHIRAQSPAFISGNSETSGRRFQRFWSEKKNSHFKAAAKPEDEKVLDPRLKPRRSDSPRFHHQALQLRGTRTWRSIRNVGGGCTETEERGTNRFPADTELVTVSEPRRFITSPTLDAFL